MRTDPPSGNDDLGNLADDRPTLDDVQSGSNDSGSSSGGGSGSGSSSGGSGSSSDDLNRW